MPLRRLKPPTELSVGFTGTQEGMTPKQEAKVRELLVNLDPTHAHHGDCVGADAEFHSICRALGLYIIGHPGMDDNGRSPKRAFCNVDELEPVLPYLRRNGNIIKSCQILIAAPKTFEEEIRSGTWSTIRRAKRLVHTIFIVFPDGSVST